MPIASAVDSLPRGAVAVVEARMPMIASSPAPASLGTVAVIEDDPEIRDLIAGLLSREGFEVRAFGGSAKMLDTVDPARIDCLILDLMLPGEDGLDICRTLRASHPRLPILIVTARSDAVDRIVGLEIGADDYLAKPFNSRELLARLRSVIRRTRDLAGVAEQPGENLRFEGWLLRPNARSLADHNGRPVTLTTSELDLLHVLALNPQRVLSRDFLINATRGGMADLIDRVIDTQIARLRRKLGDDPREPRLIVTVRGDGYLFSPTVVRC